MALSDILQAAFRGEGAANSRMSEMPTIDQPSIVQSRQPPVPGTPDGTTNNLASLLPLLLAGKQGGNGGGGNDLAGFSSGGENPWGIDPNGMDLMTRHGVTLDDDAMQSLIEARRAGFNAFPFIGQGYRTLAESRSAYLHPTNSLPHAKPGQSMHNYGLAFDAGNLPADVRRYLTHNGWFWGNSFGDPPHYSYGREG